MINLDIPHTQLLVSSIIAAIAVVGMIVSVSMVAWQLRHRNRLETKKVEESQLNSLLAALDKPFDVALANLMDVEILRSTDPSLLVTPESLHQARPAIVADFRSAFQEFTNVATTAITVLPACRRRRGLPKTSDHEVVNLEKLLEELVEVFNHLGTKYANTARLLTVRLADWEKDPLQERAMTLLSAVRHQASGLLANLYA